MAEQTFFGREDFLLQFENAWNNDRFLGIFGLKSVGKSSTALALAKRIQGNTDNAEIVNIQQLPRNKPMKQVYLRILSELHMYEEMTYNMNQATHGILEYVHNIDHEMIIIIDDCEKVIESEEYQVFINFVQRLMQSSDRIHVIITSCVAIPDLDRHLGFFRTLPPLTDEESYTLLRTMAPNEAGPDLMKIASLCEGLPLALNMIGSQLHTYTTDEVIMLLTASRIQYLSDEFFPADEKPGFVYGQLIQRLSLLFQQRLAALEYIPASFQIEQARGMIYNISDAAPSTVPVNLQRQELDQTIICLRDRHILNFDQSAGRYNIHGILRDCIQISNVIYNKRKIRDRYCKVFASVLKSISSQLDTVEYTQALEQLSHEFPNLQKLLSDVEYSNGDTYHVFVDLVSTSSQLLHDYMGEDSVLFYHKILGITTQYGRPKDEAILRGGNGNLLTVERAKFAEGERNFRTGLALLADGPLCETHVSIYADLGFNLNHQTRKDEALEVLQRSLSIADQIGLSDEDAILKTLINLGGVYGLAEQCEKGERYLNEALNRSIKRFGKKCNRISSDCYNRLGSLKQTAQDYDSALRYFSEALEIRTEMKAGVQAMVASLNNVALQKSAHGDNKAAMSLLQRADMTLARTPGVHQLGRLATLENQGRMHHRLRKYEPAIHYINEVLRIRDVETPRNVNVMEMLELLAGSYVAQNRDTESVPIWERSISITPVVQRSIPGYQLPLYCYLGYLEVLARIGDRKRLEEVREEATQELDRLVTFHQRNNRIDLINRFKAKFRGTITTIEHTAR